MNRKILKIGLRGMLVMSLLLCFEFGHAATFTATSSGNWSSSATWSGGTVPSFLNTSDKVVISTGVTVNMDDNVTLNGALTQLDVEGTLTSTANYISVSSGTLSGKGTINVNSIALGTGAIMLFSGTVVTNDFGSAALSLKAVANLTVNQTLALTGGVLSFETGGKLKLGDNATIMLSGGALAVNGGSVGLTSSYNVSYTSGDVVAGLELTGSGLHDLTVDVSSGNSVTLAADLTVKGTLNLKSGTLNLASHNLTIMGDVANSGTGTIMTNSSSNISISGSKSLSGTISFEGSSSAVNNLTIDVGSGNHAQIGGTLEVDGKLMLNTGTLNLGSSTLTIKGDISGTGGGNLSASSTSSLVIKTASSTSGALVFASGGNTLNNLTINMSGSGSVALNSSLMISGTLTLTNGNLNIGSNQLQIMSTGSVSGGSSSSYIITGTGGNVMMALMAGASSGTMFHVGTSDHYMPARIMLNSGSGSGNVRVSVWPHVYGHGTAGTDISSSQGVVDGTWDIQSDIASGLNMNADLIWSSSAEVHGFDRTNAYVSHFTGGAWDMSATASATAEGSGMFGIQRNNITSLSPFAVFDKNTNAGIHSEVYAVDNDAVQVYPNPAKDQIRINTTGQFAKSTRLDITDINGKILQSMTFDAGHNVIPVQNLPDGIYFVKLYNNQAIAVKQFIKM